MIKIYNSGGKKQPSDIVPYIVQHTT